MNERLETIMQQYEPKLAIMVYRSTGAVTGEGEYYLESHEVNESGAIMAGKPLQQETIQAMVDAFFDERKSQQEVKGLIPANMLSFQLLPGGKYRMIWYRPAEVRVLHHATQLKLPTAKAWVPAMVYITANNHLHVYALTNDNRPTEKTKLYKAPFFNVNNGADVCLGNANIKKPTELTYTSIMKYWEDMFWLSEFSHVNGTEKVKSKNLQAVWSKLLQSKTKKKWSDIDELIAHGNKTLQSIL